MLESPLWQSGWQALGLSASPEQQHKLWQYVELLQRWNKVHNLTAVRDFNDMLVLHLWDSLSVAPYVKGTRLLDVGSGGGLPGIPLAIMYPEQHWVLLDTNGKKTRFMQQAVGELRLTNTGVIQTRVEAWKPSVRFDGIISRAFASVVDFVASSGQHLAEDGVMYAMKGRYPADELSALPAGWGVQASHALAVPSLDAERHLLMITRQA